MLKYLATIAVLFVAYTMLSSVARLNQLDETYMRVESGFEDIERRLLAVEQAINGA